MLCQLLAAPTPPRASPALVSVLWASLVRAPVVGLFGLREGGGTSLVDSRLRGNDGDACAGMTGDYVIPSGARNL